MIEFSFEFTCDDIYFDGIQGRSHEFAKVDLWDRSPPAGFRGRAPVGVWGQSPQKPETHAEYSIEQSHRSSQIAYCSDSNYTLKKFPATTGEHAPMSPLVTPLTVYYRQAFLIPCNTSCK